MDNTKNYIIISIISVVMMVPYYIWDCKILNICSGIGCSALTASVMALYIEKNNAKKEKIRLNEAKRLDPKEKTQKQNFFYQVKGIFCGKKKLRKK